MSIGAWRFLTITLFFPTFSVLAAEASPPNAPVTPAEPPALAPATQPTTMTDATIQPDVPQGSRVYKWTGEDGKIHYSNVKPNNVAQVESIPLNSANRSADPYGFMASYNNTATPVHKWTDEDGKVYYSDARPNGVTPVTEIKIDPPAAPSIPNSMDLTARMRSAIYLLQSTYVPQLAQSSGGNSANTTPSKDPLDQSRENYYKQKEEAEKQAYREKEREQQEEQRREREREREHERELERERARAAKWEEKPAPPAPSAPPKPTPIPFKPTPIGASPYR